MMHPREPVQSKHGDPSHSWRHHLQRSGQLHDLPCLAGQVRETHLRGAWYLVSYTWSKSIAVTNAPAVGGDYAYERALTAFDIRKI